MELMKMYYIFEQIEYIKYMRIKKSGKLRISFLMLRIYAYNHEINETNDFHDRVYYLDSYRNYVQIK